MDDNTKLTIAAVTAVASVFGAVIGGGLVMLKDYLQVRWSRQADRERLLRDKLHEMYTNCIFYLSHGGDRSYIFPGYVNGHEFEYGKYLSECARFNADLEAQRLKWLQLLIVHHPARGTPSFEEFVKKVQMKEIKAQDVVDLAASDPRLKVDYLK